MCVMFLLDGVEFTRTTAAALSQDAIDATHPFSS